MFQNVLFVVGIFALFYFVVIVPVRRRIRRTKITAPPVDWASPPMSGAGGARDTRLPLTEDPLNDPDYVTEITKKW